MIRLWKGIEKEGIGTESEILTLFVCANKEVKSDLLISTLECNLDIKAIYFGAGRVRFNGVDNWRRIINYCAANKIKVIMEVPYSWLGGKFIADCDGVDLFIVAMYDCEPHNKTVYFKTDDYKVTRIYTLQKEVDITTVIDNKYRDDVELFKEV